MRKIFITGFQRSGTTLTHALIKAHPQVGWIEDEQNYIEFDKGKDWVLMMGSKKVPDMKQFAWGEKIPWTDDNGKRIIGLMDMWLRYFKKQARIIQLIRHPLDVALSISPALRDELDFVLKSVPIITDYLNDIDRAASLQFEELVLNPKEKLKSLFEFLDLDNDNKTIEKVMNVDLKFGKINTERAYAYKVNSSTNMEIDYKKIIERAKNLL
jgi:hypothetical protein